MNFPKFMIRQTGGLAVGAISTRSRLASLAFWRASAIATIPRASPASPIRRTSFHRICSLTRMLFLSILHLHCQLLPSLRDRPSGERQKLLDRKRPGVSAVAHANRDRARRGFLLPDHEHRGRLLKLGLADTRAELLVLLVHLDPQAAVLELRGHRIGRGVELLRDRQDHR